MQEYRQVIIDQLMVEPESADGGFYVFSLCGDGVLYRSNCPELVKELQAIWNNEEDLQNWLANIRKEIPGIQDQQIEEQIREGFVDQYPIVKKLTLQQKIAFQGSFGDLDGLATELKRKLDRDYWRNIPNKYNIRNAVDGCLDESPQAEILVGGSQYQETELRNSNVWISGG